MQNFKRELLWNHQKLWQSDCALGKYSTAIEHGGVPRDCGTCAKVLN